MNLVQGRRSDSTVLGHRLRQLREGLGLVLQDLADYLGTRRNVPSQWETGQREPAYTHLLALADFYGVTTDWLLGREGAEKDSPRVRKGKALLQERLRLREGSLSHSTPGYRLKLAITILIENDQEMFAYSRLAAQLLMSVETLTRMVDEIIPCTQVVIQRFAHFAGLPELWFYQPEPRLEDGLKIYREVLERVQAEGISPEDLEARIWSRRSARRGTKKEAPQGLQD